MALLTCLTGSYPPEHDPILLSSDLPEETREATIQSAIRRAVNDQVEAGIDILVDGQIRDDIVALFLSKFRGCVIKGAHYVVTGKIHPCEEPITVADFQYARSLATGRLFKAHVTGPMSLARETTLATNEYKDKYDPKLILDLAYAIAQEARHLANAGAEIVQIDEPALAHGADLEMAFRAMRVVVEKGGIGTAWLHACGDIRAIFKSLVEEAYPVQALSVEGAWLDYPELAQVDGDYLLQHGKKICYGCVRVEPPNIEHLGMLQRMLERAVDRFGIRNIAAVTPNCGLRGTPYDVAKRKMRVMVEAAKSVT